MIWYKIISIALWIKCLKVLNFSALILYHYNMPLLGYFYITKYIWFMRYSIVAFILQVYNVYLVKILRTEKSKYLQLV